MPADAGPPGAVDGAPPDLEPLQSGAETVVAAVRAVLAGDRAGIDAAVARSTTTTAGARAASTLATGSLAAQMPALSGVTGAVTDEPGGPLLHAYAELLAERAEPLRRRTGGDLRDTVAQVAHRAATAAHQRHEGHAWADLARELELPGVAPDEQLVAACVLLAQTSRDGGAGVDALATELHDLAAELAGATDAEAPG